MLFVALLKPGERLVVVPESQIGVHERAGVTWLFAFFQLRKEAMCVSASPSLAYAATSEPIGRGLRLN